MDYYSRSTARMRADQNFHPNVVTQLSYNSHPRLTVHTRFEQNSHPNLITQLSNNSRARLTGTKR